jgi:predicted nuclease with RNAse H fold
MRIGFSVYQAIAHSHPRFRGGPVRGTAAEVFPEASAVLLEGRLRSKSESKAVFRRRVLENNGVDTSRLMTVDALDAALAALTGTLAIHGDHSSIGDPDEGVILLPVHSLPNGRLVRTPSSTASTLAL